MHGVYGEILWFFYTTHHVFHQGLSVKFSWLTKKKMVAYDMYNCRDPWNFSPHERDNNIPYLGGISTSTMSMTMLFTGH